MAVVDFFQFCFHMLVDGITNVGLLIHTIALFNYNLLTWLFGCISVAFHFTAHFTKVISTTAADILTNFGDFLLELLFCIKSVLIVVWKFLALVWNIVTFVLSSVEFMAIVLWNSFVWIVSTIIQTSGDIFSGCGSSLFYGKKLVGGVFNNTVAGFSAIGKSVEHLCISSWTTFVETVHFISHSSLDFVFVKLNIIKRELKYIFVDVFQNIQKEAYIGILVCLVMYLLVMNMPKILYYMHSRGLTLPFIGARDVGDLMLQDSDEESFDDSGSERSQEDNISDASEESESESVGETNDNHSVYTSESDSDIDIRLPNISNDSLTRRGLRDQSRTPIFSADRKADRSRDELEREVEQERDKRACVVCQDRPKSVLILPCRHLCLCLQCANQIVRAHFVNNRICPLCRTKIKTIMDIYV